MAHAPLFEETIAGPANPMIRELAGFAGFDPARMPDEVEAKAGDGLVRRFSVYPPLAAFDLIDELQHLARRAIEPNIFFNPRFLAPAMPRIGHHDIRIAVLRDENRLAGTSRLRFMMPYAVRKPNLGIGPSVIQVWANEFGPLGVPLIDGDDPFGVTEDMLTMLAKPALGLPRVIVFPLLMTDGPAAGMLRAAALGAGLAAFTVDEDERPVLDSRLDGEAYLAGSLSGNSRSRMRRQLKKLGLLGHVAFRVHRRRADLFDQVEAFLALEAAGWKGRKRTALLCDRLQAAFAREALDRLADGDQLRVHTLELDGKVIASTLVLVENGVGHTWKTAFDEAYADYSPGLLLTAEMTRHALKDPNIDWMDSCATGDHPMMNRIWTERRRTGTLVIGLDHAAEDAARRVQAQIGLYRQTRKAARGFRDVVRRLFGGTRIGEQA